MEEVLKVLDGFRKVLVFTVNKGKTQICTFGPRLDTEIMTLYDITRIKNIDSFKLLGIEFTHDLQDIEWNYEYTLYKFRKDLFSWIIKQRKGHGFKVCGMPKGEIFSSLWGANRGYK